MSCLIGVVRSWVGGVGGGGGGQVTARSEPVERTNRRSSVCGRTLRGLHKTVPSLPLAASRPLPNFSFPLINKENFQDLHLSRKVYSNPRMTYNSPVLNISQGGKSRVCKAYLIFSKLLFSVALMLRLLRLVTFLIREGNRNFYKK